MTTDWYWPGCKITGCGAYKECAHSDGLCIGTTGNPCDYTGNYYPGGLGALPCCHDGRTANLVLCKDPQK